MKIYSTALFGDGDKYGQYLRAWVRGALNLFPQKEDWRLFLAVDVVAMKKHERLLLRLWKSGLVRVKPFNVQPLCKAMLQRMWPVFTSLPADYTFCRDIDSPPMPRDRVCCDQFITSKATVHTLHDSDQHVGVMGGLCGFWAPRFRGQTKLNTLDALIDAAKFTDAEWNTHGADQIALNRICLRLGGPTLLEHRYNGWWNGAGARSPKPAGEYACEAYSTKTPDHGRVLIRGNFADVQAADRLGAHLGCAGYDHDAAVKFWDEHGDPEIAAKIAECEK